MAKIKLRKTKIINMFKAGAPIDVIRKTIKPSSPKITTAQIDSVIRKHLEKRADKLWSIAVKKKGRCVVTGKTTHLNAHHLIGRGNKLFRWDLNNGVCLTTHTHTFSRDIAAHGSTDATQRFAEWMETYRPAQWKWFLAHKDIKDIFIPTNTDLLNICKELEK